MKLLQILAVGIAFAAGSAAAHADQLADVKARGTLVCGTLGTAEPFSFQDPKTREIVGYDVDMCHKVADALGVKLELKPMAVEARIPELLQGRVDILAANLGWSKERAQQIDYSYSYFVSQQKVMVAADSGIKTLDQLAGKKVSALKGSSSEQGVRRVPDVWPLRGVVPPCGDPAGGCRLGQPVGGDEAQTPPLLGHRELGLDARARRAPSQQLLTRVLVTGHGDHFQVVVGSKEADGGDLEADDVRSAVHDHVQQVSQSLLAAGPVHQL